MSQLYYSERGNVIPTLGEDLTTYRRARKILHLPATREHARLYVLARAYPETGFPLRVAVNGKELPAVSPRTPDIYFWHELAIPVNSLVAGANIIEFWTDAHAMNAWSLGMEDGHRESQSFVSTDAGRSWRDENMGYLNVSLGEYIVRVRLAEGRDSAPPEMVWEDPAHPRLRDLAQRLPREALEAETTMERVRALSTWVSTSWVYRNTSDSAQYAPWDAETIIAWGQSARGHGGQAPVVMCVHYAVTMATACIAVGIPARCAIFTGGVNEFNGHFTTEVWFDEYQKWVMVDPNLDAIMFKNGVPLSVTEIRQMGSDLRPAIEWGPGHEFQIKNPVIVPWIPSIYYPGICFRHRSIWPRMDFLSHPEFSPPGHGSTSYCETNLVWEEKDLNEGFGMFPYFGNKEYFDTPPQQFPQPTFALSEKAR